MAATSLKDYLQLFKPRIMLLLDFIAVSAMIVARGFSFAWETLVALVVAGSMSSCGASIVNSYLDKDIDSLMSRTRDRPIPTGRITPRLALWLGLGLLAGALAVAMLAINLLSAAFIFLGAFFYLIVYTIWLKRRNPVNIVIGGFAGSCAVLAGWAAATGTISLTPLMMGLLVFLWTPSHFWCLALKIRDDYKSARLPMLPVIFSPPKAARWILLNTLFLIPFSILFYFLNIFGALYVIIATIMGAVLLATNIILLLNPTKEHAWTAYKFSSPYLAVLFLSMILDAVMGKF